MCVLKSSHRPDGKTADALALILALHNWERFGQLQSVRAAETFKSSHRPDGIFTCFALVLAGRRCLHQQWHGELLIVHHHWQHRSACSRSKFPIAPMGISYVSRLCLQGGGVYIYIATVSFSSCTITGNTAQYVRAHAQSSHRPNEKMAYALALTLA